MALPDFMRHDDPFISIILPVNIIENNFFISGPSTSTNDSTFIRTKNLYPINLFGKIRNLLYPIKPRITRFLNVSNPNRRQEPDRLFILYKKFREESQHLPMQTAPPFKEWLFFSEYGRNQINGNPTFAYLAQIIIPILVFYKNNGIRTYGIQKMPSI